MPLPIVQQKYNKAIPRNARWLYLKTIDYFSEMALDASRFFSLTTSA